MVLKIIAILALIFCGLLLAAPNWPATLNPPPPRSLSLLSAVGAAMVPVLFAYGGWQTASFVAGEIREPRKNLPRALIIGVIGVVVLYLLVNVVYVYVLNPDGLAKTTTPASDVMRFAPAVPIANCITSDGGVVVLASPSGSTCVDVNKIYEKIQEHHTNNPDYQARWQVLPRFSNFTEQNSPSASLRMANNTDPLRRPRRDKTKKEAGGGWLMFAVQLARPGTIRR